MILLVSNLKDDAHIPPVASELFRQGESYRIFNPGSYPMSATVTADYQGNTLVTTLRWDDSELELSSIKSVWWRRPSDYELGNTLRPEEDAWIRSECDQFLRGVWANTEARWVSTPHAIRLATFKLYQLRLAIELGFRVPRFTVTNDVDRADAFLAAMDDGAIVKSLGAPTLFNQERVAMIYTHLVTAEDREQLDSVRYGPTFLQEFIQKKMDVRVTVIGDDLFACGIESAGFEDARVDFRRAQIYDMPHRPLTLPPAVHGACLKLVRRLGLAFGAIDLLMTPDGEYVFLEINPNGQWIWIEMVTGMPMVKAMCELLSVHSTERRLSPAHQVFVGG